MPRAGDMYPARRGANDINSPLRGLLDYTSPLDMTARAVGDGIRAKIEDVVAFIKATTGVDLSGIVALVDLIGQATGKNLFSMLDANSLINAAQIVGRLLPHVIGPVSIENLFKPADDAPSALWPSDFPAGAIAANTAGWDVVLEASRSADGTGAARVIADGTWHALRSGETPDRRIPIGNRQTVNLRYYVRHNAYVGVGEPIQLHVVPYRGDMRETPVVIDTYGPDEPTIDWPGHLLSGTYTAAPGVDSFQIRPVVTDGALSGVIDFDDGRPKYAGGGIQIPWIPGLPEAIDAAENGRQLIIDTIVNAIKNTGLFGNSLPDLDAALRELPWENVIGVLGHINIGESFKDFLNMFVGGAVGQPGTGATPAHVFNITQQLSSWARLGAWAWDLLGFRNGESVASGYLPSGQSNFDLLGTPTEELPVTAAASVMSVQRFKDAAAIGVISWIGRDVTNLTGFWVNLWKVDANGDLHRVYASPNILTSVDGQATPQFNFHELPEPIPREQGDEFFREIVVAGTGTYKVLGTVAKTTTGTNIPVHPTAAVRSFGAARTIATGTHGTPPAFIPGASLTRTPNTPWFELAVDMGTDLANDHAPLVTSLEGYGEWLVPIPVWSNIVHVIMVSKGGDGSDGLSLNFNGVDGEPGKWVAVSLVRGVDFDDSVDLLKIQLALDACRAIIPSRTVTVQSGADGSGVRFGGRPKGRGPVPFEYNGTPYVGGNDQNRWGSNGIPPGGAATGGQGLLLPQQGGRGAPPAAWIVAAKGTPPPPADVTPPTAPMVELVATTPGTITVRAVGGTDDRGIIGHNFSIDGVVDNVEMVPAGDEYMFVGQLSETEHEITATNIDEAGWESEPSPVLRATTAAYENPDGAFPMEAHDRARIDQIVAEEMVSPGAVMGISGPRGFYTQAYGVASGGRPMTPEDRVRIASLTKTFTATAIFMAVDRGEITLDDTIDQYVSGIPNGTKITIRHLLTMRSGLPDYNTNLLLIGLYMLWPTYPNFNETTLLQYIRALTPLAPPGEMYAYSNTNFVLLGAILRKVTGRAPRTIVMEDILEPLGMTETMWPLPSQTGIPKPAALNDSRNPEFLGAAGGMISTVRDMLKWGEAMRDGVLISADLHAQWLEYMNPVPWSGLGPTHFGYGMGIIEFGRWLGHDGSWMPMDGVCFWERESGAVFVMYGNSQSAGLVPLSRMLTRIGPYLYPGSTDTQDYPIIPAPVKSRRRVGEPVVGRHVLFGGNTIGTTTASGSTDHVTPVAEDGDYVVFDILVDRGAGPTNVKYNGVEMTPHGNVTTNNDANVYRFGARHTGPTAAGRVTASLPWSYNMPTATVLKNVSAVLSTETVAAKAATLSQGPIVCPEGGLVLQTFSIGHGGAVPALSGGENRAAEYASYSGLVVNTSMVSTSFTATFEGRTPAMSGIATVFV